ncbi:MAG: hypothetical protein ACRDHW_11960, partial [Ktedonobacteraceae bacterium]
MSIRLIVGDLAGSSAASAAAHIVLLLVILLGVTLLVALVARRLRLPYTLILVIFGFLIGVAPVLNEVVFNPDIV